MGGLLELQQQMGGNNNGKMNLQTARSRIRSMAMAHEALYQHDSLADISMKEYIENIASYTFKSINNPNIDILLKYELADARLEMAKSIPLGLLVNETLINALKHAFKERKKGTIHLKSTNENGKIVLVICDDGVGLPQGKEEGGASRSLGMTLIKKFAKQLQGTLDITSTPGAGTSYKLCFEI